MSIGPQRFLIGRRIRARSHRAKATKIKEQALEIKEKLRFRFDSCEWTLLHVYDGERAVCRAGSTDLLLSTTDVVVSLASTNERTNEQNWKHVLVKYTKYLFSRYTFLLKWIGYSHWTKANANIYRKNPPESDVVFAFAKCEIAFGLLSPVQFADFSQFWLRIHSVVMTSSFYGVYFYLFCDDINQSETS